MANKHKRLQKKPSWYETNLSFKLFAVHAGMSVFLIALLLNIFFNNLINFSMNVYDEAVSGMAQVTEETARYIQQQGGIPQDFDAYLEKRNIGCIVNRQNTMLYQSDMVPKDGLSMFDTAEIEVEGGQLHLSVWSDKVDREDLSRRLGLRSLNELVLFSIGVMAIAGFLIYLVLLVPIKQLRQTMRNYLDTGIPPPRSTRTDEVGRLHNAFADITNTLAAKEQSEHRLIGSLSHDIKTPLTSVLGYSERLMTASLDEQKQKRYISNIHEKGLVIKQLVDELESYVEVGLSRAKPKNKVTIGEICEELEKEYAFELDEAHIAFSVQCDCPSAKIMCDTTLISRYFGNLIANSIRHSGAERLSIEILFVQYSNRVRIIYSDNGKGVDSALLQKIFEPLYTTDKGRKVSGLGLSICRSIISSHGGTVRAENQSGGGGILIIADLPIVK